MQPPCPQPSGGKMALWDQVISFPFISDTGDRKQFGYFQHSGFTLTDDFTDTSRSRFLRVHLPNESYCFCLSDESNSFLTVALGSLAGGS